jgi:hypothetical protein
MFYISVIKSIGYLHNNTSYYVTQYRKTNTFYANYIYLNYLDIKYKIIFD